MLNATFSVNFKHCELVLKAIPKLEIALWKTDSKKLNLSSWQHLAHRFSSSSFTTICHITLSNVKLSRWTEMNEIIFPQSSLKCKWFFIQIFKVAKNIVFASFTLLSDSSCIFVNRHFCQSMKISLEKKLFRLKERANKNSQCLKIMKKVSFEFKMFSNTVSLFENYLKFSTYFCPI